MVKYLLGALALLLSLSLVWGFREQGKADVARTELNAATADLVSLRATLDTLNREAARRVELDITQSESKAKAVRSVKAVRTETEKEAHETPEPRPVASATQLDRLRRLAEASNAATASATAAAR